MKIQPFTLEDLVIEHCRSASSNCLCRFAVTSTDGMVDAVGAVDAVYVVSAVDAVGAVGAVIG